MRGCCWVCCILVFVVFGLLILVRWACCVELNNEAFFSQFLFLLFLFFASQYDAVSQLYSCSPPSRLQVRCAAVARLPGLPPRRFARPLAWCCDSAPPWGRRELGFLFGEDDRNWAGSTQPDPACKPSPLTNWTKIIITITGRCEWEKKDYV